MSNEIDMDELVKSCKKVAKSFIAKFEKKEGSLEEMIALANAITRNPGGYDYLLHYEDNESVVDHFRSGLVKYLDNFTRIKVA